MSISHARSLVLAAALSLTIGVAGAAAQTVVVTNAVAGSKVDVVLNTNGIASANVDEGGHANIPLKVVTDPKAETTVHVYVDLCGKTERIVLIEAGLQPEPQDPGCDRKEMPGWFMMRSVTTLFVDMSKGNPTVYVRQGPPPPEWMHAAAGEEIKVAEPAPSGLVVFASYGIFDFGKQAELACGDAPFCGGRGIKGGFTAGGMYWFRPFIGVEATYLKPRNATLSGQGANFQFDTTLDARVVTTALVFGIPFSNGRVFVKGGADWHEATLNTTETLTETPATVDGQPAIIPGGVQSLQTKTQGWSYMFGGGFEIWPWSRMGIYADAGRAKLKGPAINGQSGEMDDALNYLTVGVRLHVWTKKGKRVR